MSTEVNICRGATYVETYYDAPKWIIASIRILFRLDRLRRKWEAVCDG